MNTTKRQVRVLNDKHSKQQKNEIFASAKNKKRKNDSTAEKARENYNYNYFSFFFSFLMLSVSVFTLCLVLNLSTVFTLEERPFFCEVNESRVDAGENSGFNDVCSCPGRFTSRLFC